MPHGGGRDAVGSVDDSLGFAPTHQSGFPRSGSATVIVPAAFEVPAGPSQESHDVSRPESESDRCDRAQPTRRLAPCAGAARSARRPDVAHSYVRACAPHPGRPFFLSTRRLRAWRRVRLVDRRTREDRRVVSGGMAAIAAARNRSRSRILLISRRCAFHEFLEVLDGAVPVALDRPRQSALEHRAERPEPRRGAQRHGEGRPVFLGRALHL